MQYARRVNAISMYIGRSVERRCTMGVERDARIRDGHYCRLSEYEFRGYRQRDPAFSGLAGKSRSIDEKEKKNVRRSPKRY